jgi:membrane associated rhomboid family serine protease
MYYNQSAGDKLKSMLQMQPALTRLVMINIGVWFLLALVQVAGFLSAPADLRGDLVWLESVLKWIGVPASVPVLLQKPWTIITYMFVQEGFWHLFFNMIWLYWFGKIFMEFMPGNKIYFIYFIGGISGASTFILAYNVFPVFEQSVFTATTIGASASVLAITVATAVLVPAYSVNLMFIGPVKIKYIALFTIVLDVLMIKSGNSGGHFAHLGGAISGALFILLIRHNWVQQFGFLNFKLGSLNPFKPKPLKKVYGKGKPLCDEEYNKLKVKKQEKIDKILDKISSSGYSSLSAEEKAILFKSSNNL